MDIRDDALQCLNAYHDKRILNEYMVYIQYIYVSALLRFASCAVLEVVTVLNECAFFTLLLQVQQTNSRRRGFERNHKWISVMWLSRSRIHDQTFKNTTDTDKERMFREYERFGFASEYYVVTINVMRMQ